MRNVTAVPGTLIGSDIASLHFRFAIPNKVLQRLHGERVDLWTITEISPELSGRQARVHSRPLTPKNKLNGTVYATIRGNLSLDLRKLRA